MGRVLRKIATALKAKAAWSLSKQVADFEFIALFSFVLQLGFIHPFFVFYPCGFPSFKSKADIQPKHVVLCCITD